MISEQLRAAEQRAAEQGRTDIADYLRLKGENDAVRRAAVEWLIRTTIDAASEAARHNFGIEIEREEPHRFPHGASTMVGELLLVRRGVRRFTVEAGWARAPNDGIMVGHSLARARLTHFGISGATEELRLIRNDLGIVWLKDTDVFSSEDVDRHITLLVDG
jgi:hypothetical protein